MALIVKRVGPIGRGVFTDVDIPACTVVEVSHVLLLTLEQADQVTIRDYVYAWSDTHAALCIGGFGSLYNHSSEPNIECQIEPGSEEIWFWATKDIPAGSELCHFYNNHEFQ